MAQPRLCSHSPTMDWVMTSKTEVEMMMPRMTLKPSSTSACWIEPIRPGNP